ncbi:unnamed protein product [Coregonus sp. 'balchen']|nr:unnamed protein product [Coregonus sp. 'balchen']
MALADQSQQWYPTSVQVTVFQARNLRIKGKNGTNDAYAIMQVAKDKFSTSVAEKCVAPVWKEEATFDLPLFHHGNAERCTLYIIVMHRALVGLDKFLGQAVVNLLELNDNSARKRTENNLTASMFDLSMQDKPRSRIGKLKDKVRGKKKDSFSDSSSAIVPSVSQVLTDSEGEADSHSVYSEFPEAKKKSKLKTLFAPKSNLQRNVSQSMSTLGTLPEKNASLSGSRSSGLNVDSPDVKKKFKFLGHKRTGSNDSKVSTGPFSLLGRSKQKDDPNSTCINGNHVYAEEVEPKSGSTLSLNSSGQGSVEDVRSRRQPSDVSVDSLKGLSVPTYRKESADRALLEQRSLQEEEEEKRQAEEKRWNEEKHRAQLKILQEEEECKQQEEQERRRRFQEDEARRNKQREEELKCLEEERRRLEAEELQRLGEDQRQQEETKRAEEQKQQEEASVAERLSSLFGMIMKKEEKKEEQQQTSAKEERPNPAPRRFTRDLAVPPHATNQFEEIPLSPDPPNLFEQSPVDSQKDVCSPNTTSAAVFLNSNRTAKVSTSKSPYSSPENLAAIGPSPNGSDKKRQAPLSPSPMEPQSHGKPNAGSRSVSAKSAVASGYPVKEVEGKIPPLPLPDYDSLFPQKRHGVLGQTRWDHIIAEVNQRQQEYVPQLIGKEMSVDGPDLDSPVPPRNDKYSYVQERAAEPVHQQQTQVQEVQSTSLRRVGPNSFPALTPPSKPVAAATPRLLMDSNTNQGQSTIQANPSEWPNAFVSKVLVSTKPVVQSRDIPSVTPLEDARKVINTSVATASDGKPVLSTEKPRPTSQAVSVSSSTDEPKGLPNTPKEIPTVKPRQRLVRKEPVRPADHEQMSAESTTVEKENRSERRASTLDIMELRRSSPVTEKNTEVTSDNEKQLSFDSAENDIEKKTQLERIMKAKFAEPDPFPIADILPKDQWAQPEQSGDYLFTRGPQKNRKLKEQAMTTNDLDKLFAPNNPTDPFASFNDCDSDEPPEQEKTEEQSPAFQRGFSQIKKKRGAPQPPANSSNKAAIGKIELDKEDPSPREDKLISSATTTGCVKLPPQTQNTRQSKLYGREGVETQDKPHPVKPMSSIESQAPISTRVVGEMLTYDRTLGKMKAPGMVESGPYTQLTQEELITLVVKQQTELSKKDSKIVELEEYIDNLLVRVIEEKPSILLGLNSVKQAL